MVLLNRTRTNLVSSPVWWSGEDANPRLQSDYINTSGKVKKRVMNGNDLEKHFSAARLGRYRTARSGDEVAAASDYAYNLRLAEAMMPVLNTLRIALSRI